MDSELSLVVVDCVFQPPLELSLVQNFLVDFVLNLLLLQLVLLYFFEVINNALDELFVGLLFLF